MNKDNPEYEILQFQMQRIFSSLGRNILILLEDLKFQHKGNFDKLRANLPLELEPAVDLADYFDENTYSYYRGKVLNLTMQAKRDLESIIENK